MASDDCGSLKKGVAAGRGDPPKSPPPKAPVPSRPDPPRMSVWVPEVVPATTWGGFGTTFLIFFGLGPEVNVALR